MFNTVACMSEYRRGFGLDFGFIDHFNTALVTTLNYSAIANSTPNKITLCLFQLVVYSLVVAW
jgi:hypothetical protein